ncbi:MAG: substrate-binding domain-containing protein [Spirochaetales bacterium]|nr:substrate-binding domain-containing protein [Spirochaetales bacterium]
MRVGLYLKNLDEEYQISVFKGIRSEAARVGIDLFCMQGGLSSPGKFLPVDGVLLLTSALFAEMSDIDIPAIKNYFSSTPWISIGNNLEGIPSISIRNRKSMEQIMDHLVAFHGCRKLLFISGPAGHPDNSVREAVFRETLCNRSSEFPGLEGVVRNGGFWESYAIDIMREYIATHPDSPLDAVVAANDSMAIGALKVLRSASDPRWKSCKVTGFDDIPQARLEIPALTTVQQPLEELGRLAVRTIHALIEKKEAPEICELDSVPVIRNSCGCRSPEPDAALVPDAVLSRVQYQSFRSEQHLRNVSSFGQLLTTVGSMHELVRYLQAFLNSNDVKTFFFLLFPQSDTAKSGDIELIYRRFRNEEKSFADRRERTTLAEFFSSNFRENEKIPASASIHNLTSGTDELGIIVYEIDDYAHPHLCSAAIFIANTVRRLMILEDEKKRSRKLEREVLLRTKDLVESNRKLKAEAKRRLEVEAEVLHISEMERLRFSLDLHDDICQRLAGISMYSKSLDSGSDLGELSEMIDETLNRTRQYAHDSFPVELDSLGLNEAVASLCRSVQKQTLCACGYSWEAGADIRLANAQEINLYRIIQEAVHNTVKHARATRVDISVRLEDGALAIRVRDNGTGISGDTPARPKKKPHVGIGLKSMEYRAHQIGAQYLFRSSAKDGTLVEIRLPL